jgi:hypothetical protein
MRLLAWCWLIYYVSLVCATGIEKTVQYIMIIVSSTVPGTLCVLYVVLLHAACVPEKHSNPPIVHRGA